MKRIIVFAAIIFIALQVGLAAQETGSNGGIGIFMGAALPQGSTATITSTDWSPSLNWGFYVNIPLISTFHLTTSSELYKLGTQNATDFTLAFKFMIPLSGFSLYCGVASGLTSVNDALDVHVGAIAGGTFKLVSNLDVFAQVKYNFVFDGSQNIRVLHVNGGLLLNF
jgi:hypothetical protein